MDAGRILATVFLHQHMSRQLHVLFLPTMMFKNSRFLSTIQLLFLLSLCIFILHSPAEACSHAALALRLWFEKMIPSLFPFMILSGLIVRLDFGRLLALPVYPFLGRLYQINKTMCTTLLMGFLFGFPLGAKTIAEEYSLGQLSGPQAQYLLSFCNNIGPVYLLSFALPLLGFSSDSSDRLLLCFVIASFFGIPLNYGLILRYTVYRSVPLAAGNSRSVKNTALPAPSLTPHTASKLLRPEPPCAVSKHPGSGRRTPLTAASIDSRNMTAIPSFMQALDASVTSACAAITRLGGYMIFFIVCNLPMQQAASFLRSPAARNGAAKLAVFAAPILEITSGLALSKDALSPALFMTMLTFGGLSCFAQTYTCIRDTDLSFGNYCFHKILQSVIAFCLYALLFSAFSGKLPL